MRYIAAYVLALMGGNENPKVEDLQKIIGSVGVDFDQTQAKMVIDQLAGKDLEEVIEDGRGKLAFVPCGATRNAFPNVGQVEINIVDGEKMDAGKSDTDSDTDDEGGLMDLFSM